MKRIGRALAYHFKLNTCNALFPFSVLICLFMCLCSRGYTDYATAKEYAIIQLLFSEIPMEMEFQEVLREGFVGWLYMFIPIVAPLPAVVIRKINKAKHVNRLSTYRCPRFSYSMAKVLSFMLSSILVVVLGCILFIGVCRMSFNGESDVTQLIRLMEGVTLYTTICSVCVMLVSLLIDNVYLILSMQFILEHMCSRIHQYLTARDAFANSNSGILGIIIDSNSLNSLYELDMMGIGKWLRLKTLIIFILGISISMICEMTREDYGR